LPQRKGAKQRNKPSLIKHRENPTPKQNSWWATELIPEPRPTYKLTLPHLTEAGSDQAAAFERIN
jgi:hypothetical protein